MEQQKERERESREMEEERVVVGKENDDVVIIGEGEMKSPNNKNENEIQGEGSTTSSSSSSKSMEEQQRGKSCKGCLYYSSTLKSNSRNPLCVGITRSLPQVPRYIVGENELEASKEGRNLTDFRYACVGYSLYPDRKKKSTDEQETQSELPVCVGIELLVDRSVPTPGSVPAHVHTREDGHGFPQPRSHKPTHSVGDEFLSRFSRNASLVATGVAKNMCKVGNHIKQRVDDILYPYRRRSK